MNEPWFITTTSSQIRTTTTTVSFSSRAHGLIFWMRLDEVTNMRASDADFGILPIPKYEEAQDKYYSMVSRYITGLPSIPITLTGEKLDEVGLVLEALSAESYYTLIPEYIETSLKTKNSRDAESADMLDIIINNRVFDPMHIYNFGASPPTTSASETPPTRTLLHGSRASRSSFRRLSTAPYRT